MKGTDKLNVSRKRCTLSLKGAVFACALLACSSLFFVYAKFGNSAINIIPVNVDKLDNRTFYVNRFKLFNDFLELSGQYDRLDNGANVRRSDTVLKLKGIENILHKIKPVLLEDEQLEATVLPFENFFRVSRMVRDIRCNKLFKGDKNETEKAKALLETKPTAREQISAEEYINITTDCQIFQTNRGYILSHLTKEEQEFPIAFSILMFKDIWQFERLLRAIYRPQNFYCIHVDSKSDQMIFTAVQNIVKCFDNVFIASKRFDVQWGTMTVLEPDIYCMQELWNRSTTWKYFINLTGQEFPLRTNYELVRILKAYNGANDVESTIKRANKDRWAKAGPPPHGITAVKGSVHVIVCRGYVDFVLHDTRASDLLNWTRKTRVPDETFFATLNHNPSLNVPGSYRGLPETDREVKPFVSRFKNWGTWPCAGKRVRAICVFGLGDLPLLALRKELFANKFHVNFERFTLDCMEELHFNHTRDEYLGKLVFDSRWYSKLGFVLNKVD